MFQPDTSRNLRRGLTVAGTLDWRRVWLVKLEGQVVPVDQRGEVLCETCRRWLGREPFLAHRVACVAEPLAPPYRVEPQDLDGL